MPVSRRACNYCRAHKLKCEWFDALNTCAQCQTRKTLCEIPPLSSRTHRAQKVGISTVAKGPRTILLSKSLENEDRLRKLEESIKELRNLLPVSAPSDVSPGPQTNNHQILVVTPTVEKQTSDSTVESNGDEHEASMLPTEFDNLNEILNVQITDLTKVEAELSSANTCLPHPTMLLKNCVKGKCYVPPLNDGVYLLSEFLQNFNTQIPLFHPETVYSHIRDCYAGTADRTPLYWVLTYVAFGIAHRLRAMNLLASINDTSNADWYLGKCLAVLPDLLLKEPSLPLIQALLGVSILLQTSTSRRRAPLFVSTAMHMAQDLGFNEANPETHRQEFHVFWISFFMNTTMSLHAVRPNSQKLIDISAPLPKSRSKPTISKKSESLEIDFFALHASLAMIQAEALEELFSIKARQRPVDLMNSEFNRIVSLLETWRSKSPFPSTNVVGIVRSMYWADIIHTIVLEATYFETLFQLHAANVLGGFTNRLHVFSPDGLRAATELMSFDVLAEAQHLLMIAALIPQGNVSITWIAINALIAALCTVLSCQIQENAICDAILTTSNPHTTISSYDNILRAIEVAAAQVHEPDLNINVDFCRQLYTQAKENNHLLLP